MFRFSLSHDLMLWLSLACFAFLMSVASVMEFASFAPQATENMYLELLVMLILAEPHFAMTIPLLVGYRKLATKKKFHYVTVPLLIAVVAGFLFFFSTTIFSILFLMANLYHVNRQSSAMLILQGRGPKDMVFPYEILLHATALLYFCLRPFEIEMREVGVLLILGLSSIFFYIYSIKHQVKLTKRIWLVFVQGQLVFLPVAIFDNLLTAFAVGISIHYIQYLSLGLRVSRNAFRYSWLSLLVLLGTYSVLSTGALSGFFTDVRISFIVFVPTLFQLLHFYYDGLIWKRSETLISEKLGSAGI